MNLVSVLPSGSLTLSSRLCWINLIISVESQKRFQTIRLQNKNELKAVSLQYIGLCNGSLGNEFGFMADDFFPRLKLPEGCPEDLQTSLFINIQLQRVHPLIFDGSSRKVFVCLSTCLLPAVAIICVASSSMPLCMSSEALRASAWNCLRTRSLLGLRCEKCSGVAVNNTDMRFIPRVAVCCCCCCWEGWGVLFVVVVVDDVVVAAFYLIF